MHLPPLLLLLSSASLSLAGDLVLYLPSKPNPFALPPSTHATLSSLGTHLSAPLSAANTFVFHNITGSSYLADVHCPTEAFAPLRIDVRGYSGRTEVTGPGLTGLEGRLKAHETFRGNEWGNQGEAAVLRDGGVELRPLGGKTVFVERPAFSLLSILKSPMILMGLGTMGLVFGMPYLMDNMDPELRAEFEKSQQSNPMNSIMGNAQAGQPLGNFDMAAYLAGSNRDSDSGSGSGAGGRASDAGGRAAAAAGRQQGVRR